MNYFAKANHGKNKWYLYILGFVLTILGYTIGQIPLFFIAQQFSKSFPNSGNAFNDAVSSNNFEALGMSNNLTFFLLILMFAFGTLGLWFSVKYLHNKKFIHLTTPDSKFDINRFLFGFGVWLIIGIIFEFIMYGIHPTEVTFQFNPSKFFILFLIALFFLPIQTSFEEFLVRGYIMQGLSLLFKNKIFLMVLSSVLFALFHLMNPEIEKYGLGIMMTYYVLAGVSLALFTIMDGRLELALGIHFATNFYGATVTTYEGSVIQTDALFKQGEINPQLMVFGLVCMSLIFYLIASKIYSWRSINYLLEPVVFDKDESVLLVNNNVNEQS